MPGWLVEVLQGVAVVVITAVIVAFYRRWNAARLRSSVNAGRPVKFDASLRGGGPPYPRHFRAGWVTLGFGPPTWKPRFSVLRRPVALPMSAVVESIRPLSGLREFLTVDADCHIIVGRAEGATFELAVLDVDLIAALQALASASGGAWRVPVQLQDVDGADAVT